MVLIREKGSVFSRSKDCPGTVAAFGARAFRSVLGDLRTFGLPPSFAAEAALPGRLIGLNRSLHSMVGIEHDRQKHRLGGALAACDFDAYRLDLQVVMEGLRSEWEQGSQHLLSAMRALAVRSAAVVLLGARTVADHRLTSLLEAYFHVRRQAAASGAFGGARRGVLVQLGCAVDAALRSYLRGRRRRDRDGTAGVLEHMARHRDGGRPAFSEDELVGHSNIFFVSATEPVAAALTWVLLLLSQRPELTRQLREELQLRRPPLHDPGSAFPLMDGVILETLRLLPPNALMVRVARQPAVIADVPLPAGCEVVLCPFLAHREPSVFASPGAFLPSRWNGSPPSSFDYLPFGAGGHACIGRSLAMSLIRAAVAFVVSRYDVTLDGDQNVDWAVQIMLLPRSDPRVTFAVPQSGAPGGRLKGGVARLLAAEWC